MSDQLTSARRFPAPSPVAVLGVVESVFYGLLARHAYDDGLTLAVPLTFVFFLLVPMVDGCRSVAAGESSVGVLSLSVVMRMLLTGAVCGGLLGLVSVMVLLPFSLLMALLGGIPASLVLGFRRWRKDGKELISRRAAEQQRSRGPSLSLLLCFPA